jgi:hypothetical protein
MPTLQEITLAHSQRLSEIYRTRDIRLAQAQAVRDSHLRALPGAAAIFNKYDDELSVARDKQLATENKAEAARSAALMIAIDRRTDRLEDAQLARRSADVEAVAAKRRAEDAANRKYEAAIADRRDVAPKDRAKAAADAERTSREELDAARKAHDEALAVSQQRYRAAVDEALVTERRDSRDTERAYLDAITLGGSAARGATSAADQTLAAALAKLPEAAEVMRAWRDELATIGAETKQAEKEAFSAFRRGLESIRV